MKSPRIPQPTAKRVATAGESFPDAMIDLVADPANSRTLKLLIWDGTKAKIALQIKYGGRTYEPVALHPTESFVHAPPTGGYGIVVCVRIVALKSGINLSGCEITPRKWRDDTIELQPAPERLGYYKAVGGVEYPKDVVLNPWISNTRSLGYGHVLQGVLIARSFASLPSWCVNGISVEADLCLFDQFENQYPLKVDLRVTRDAKSRARLRRSTGIFGPAVDASMHGAHVEKTELSDRDDISRKAPSMPRPNGAAH